MGRRWTGNISTVQHQRDYVVRAHDILTAACTTGYGLAIVENAGQGCSGCGAFVAHDDLDIHECQLRRVENG